jgi:threonine dehydrogenase-like Zn-dependent dehydrogenase
MRALVFRHNLAREAASAIGGRVDRRAFVDFVAAGLDLTPVITHRFPLERWDEAVLALKDARRTGAVKVLLEP